MVRLVFVCALCFLIAFAGIALVKVWAVLVITLVYGGHYQWGRYDAITILKQGILLGCILCTFAVVAYFKRRK